MATSRKVLGQQQLTATPAPLALYTVPALTSCVVSTLIVCAWGGANQFSLRVRVGGAAIDAKQLLFAAQPIAANQTIALTAGITLGAGDIVEVFIGVAQGVSFSLFGEETT
jgi:hypothetical protein